MVWSRAARSHRKRRGGAGRPGCSCGRSRRRSPGPAVRGQAVLLALDVDLAARGEGVRCARCAWASRTEQVDAPPPPHQVLRAPHPHEVARLPRKQGRRPPGHGGDLRRLPHADAADGVAGSRAPPAPALRARRSANPPPCTMPKAPPPARRRLGGSARPGANVVQVASTGLRGEERRTLVGTIAIIRAQRLISMLDSSQQVEEPSRCDS
jgi:hypothetical protein